MRPCAGVAGKQQRARLTRSLTLSFLVYYRGRRGRCAVRDLSSERDWTTYVSSSFIKREASHTYKKRLAKSPTALPLCCSSATYPHFHVKERHHQTGTYTIVFGDIVSNDAK